MSTITASQARRELFPLLEKVNDDRDVIRITSKGGNGVLMSEADYDAWMTTFHLFSTPANEARLMSAYRKAQRGQVEYHELDID